MSAGAVGPTAAPPPPLVLGVEGEMTIYRAPDLKKAFLDALASGAPIRIDLSRVTEIDTTGVQLLVLVRHLADGRNRDLALVAPSDVVRGVLQSLDLERRLGLSPNAPR